MNNENVVQGKKNISSMLKSSINFASPRPLYFTHTYSGSSAVISVSLYVVMFHCNSLLYTFFFIVWKHLCLLKWQTTKREYTKQLAAVDNATVDL
jgi:hypothetical protein